MSFTPLPNSTTPTCIVINDTGTGGDQTVFTPPTGKSVRVLGWTIYGGADSTAIISIKVGGTTIAVGTAQTQITTVLNKSAFEEPKKYLGYDGAVNAVIAMNVSNTVPYSGMIVVQVF